MWAVTNCTPFAVDGGWTRNKDGVHEWIVAVKATYDLGPDGQVSLADEQPPPLLTPVHHGEPGRSSLRYGAELVRPKLTTDILLMGSAYAPEVSQAESSRFACGSDPSARFCMSSGIAAGSSSPWWNARQPRERGNHTIDNSNRLQ